MTYISFLNHIKSLINIKPDFNYNQYQNRILDHNLISHIFSNGNS